MTAVQKQRAINILIDEYEFPMIKAHLQVEMYIGGQRDHHMHDATLVVCSDVEAGRR